MRSQASSKPSQVLFFFDSICNVQKILACSTTFCERFGFWKTCFGKDFGVHKDVLQKNPHRIFLKFSHLSDSDISNIIQILCYEALVREGFRVDPSLNMFFWLGITEAGAVLPRTLPHMWFEKTSGQILLKSQTLDFVKVFWEKNPGNFSFWTWFVVYKFNKASSKFIWFLFETQFFWVSDVTLPGCADGDFEKISSTMAWSGFLVKFRRVSLGWPSQGPNSSGDTPWRYRDWWYIVIRYEFGTFQICIYIIIFRDSYIYHNHIHIIILHLPKWNHISPT